MRSLLQIASILFLLLLSAAAAADNTSAPNLPPSKLQSLSISAVGAFASTNITLILTVPNRLIPSSAANRSPAALWLQYSHPRTPISLISARPDAINTTADNTTFSFFNVMTTSFPPSAAKLFREAIPHLHATNSSLRITFYPHNYNISRINSKIPVGSVPFQEPPFNFIGEVFTGVMHRNFLVDMMVNVVIAAVAVAIGDMIFG